MATTDLSSSIDRLRKALRTVPDFPKPGIQFIDITPILQNGQYFRLTINLLLERYAKKRLDAIVAIDARGFVFGAAVAHALGIGFIPIRKKGKLPWETLDESYDLEYGSATVSIHKDAVAPGQRVALIDDVLATGGTAAAAANLLDRLGADLMEISFIIELGFLHGRDKLPGRPLYSIITL
jgi:adenine phosphoribosyltransferase